MSKNPNPCVYRPVARSPRAITWRVQVVSPFEEGDFIQIISLATQSLQRISGRPSPSTSTNAGDSLPACARIGCNRQYPAPPPDPPLPPAPLTPPPGFSYQTISSPGKLTRIRSTHPSWSTSIQKSRKELLNCVDGS